MEQPVRRVPRLTPEARLKIRFESDTNRIRDLLNAGDIWLAKRVAKGLVRDIDRSCNDSELQGQYFDKIGELCGFYVSISDILGEHRYKSEARLAEKARFKGIR